MPSLRHRVLPVLAVLLGAPVTAELIQAYLGSTGDAAQIGVAVVFLAPLYGGAALLIREVAVRTGRGWVCRLLLAAAFGTAMTGVVDLSLFGADRPDIAYWADYRAPTAIDALGLSAAPAVVWISGHVIMSIGVPLALLDALAPGVRGRPLLGRVGIVALAVLGAAVAVAVFSDGRRLYGYTPSPAQAAGVLVVVALLVVAALSVPRPGRAPSSHRAGVGPGRVLVGALVAKCVLDVVPPTWWGLGLVLVLLGAGATAVTLLSRRRRWGDDEIGLLAAGALLAAALLGFTNPVPEGVSAAAKYAQNAVTLVLCAALAVVVLRAAGRSRSAPQQPQV